MYSNKTLNYELLKESLQTKKTTENAKKLDLKAKAPLIKNAIDKYCKETYDDGFRNHLGASLIGRECSRFLYYSFKWCFKEDFDGRIQRLFNRGHREEERFIEWLRGVGFTVWEYDFLNNRLLWDAVNDNYVIKPVSDSFDNDFVNVSDNFEHHKIAKAKGLKFPQFRVTGVNGHFGGSCDGIALPPPELEIPGLLLLEFKTSGTGAKFTNTVNHGMALDRPEHYAQASVYGTKIELSHVLYMIINKNDDDLHVEIEAINDNLGEQMELKAETIIFAKSPPPRISDNPTYYKCKICKASDICHNNKPVLKNCRSCAYSVPIENAEWGCLQFPQQGAIPKDFIKKGCDLHKSVSMVEE